MKRGTYLKSALNKVLTSECLYKPDFNLEIKGRRDKTKKYPTRVEIESTTFYFYDECDDRYTVRPLRLDRPISTSHLFQRFFRRISSSFNYFLMILFELSPDSNLYRKKIWSHLEDYPV
jgi:hypothetical protein